MIHYNLIKARIMSLHLHQTLNATGYITDAKFLYGTTGDFEYHLGYHFGRLAAGFFVGHLVTLPEANDFDLAGYSTVAEHRFKKPENLDIQKLKSMEREKMFEIGARHLVKVFPNTRHNASLHSDDQYPPGAGIPQWKLTNELPMYIFKEVETHYKGHIHLV